MVLVSISRDRLEALEDKCTAPSCASPRPLPDGRGVLQPPHTMERQAPDSTEPRASASGQTLYANFRNLALVPSYLALIPSSGPRLGATLQHSVPDHDGLDSGNAVDWLDRVTHLGQRRLGIFIEVLLQIQHVRPPLLVKARQINDILSVQIKVQHIQDHLQHAGSDAR